MTPTLPMCNQQDCNIRRNCLRYVAVPVENQNYLSAISLKRWLKGRCKQFVFKGGVHLIKTVGEADCFNRERK